LLLMLFVVTPIVAWGQIAHGDVPRGYALKSSLVIPFVTMPKLDNKALIARDAYSWDKQGPYRFGENITVDLGPDNSGVWTNLANGDRVWNLGIRSAGAFSLNLIFSEYKLPPGARLFIYNEDKSNYIGSFDHRNNKSHGKLATIPVKGEAIVIEYFEPQSHRGIGRLRVGRVTHAYRDLYAEPKSLIPGFGAADPCTINTHCPQGDDWQDESRSALMLMVNGSGLCSATLVNNSSKDGTPYVLTAHHCLGDMDGSTFVSLFNYESPVCDNSYPRIDQSVSGMVIRAKNKASDFALLEMSEAPPASYNVLYSGWTRSKDRPERYISIGHPSGDIKKWSEERPRGREYNYWWSSPKLNSGQTEYGSSGSGVWDQNGRLVGQLYGGSGWCDDVDLINYWGRFDRSWEGDGSDTTRLKKWLDPAGTDTLYIDHFDPNASMHPVITFQLNILHVEDMHEGGAVRLHLKGKTSPVAMADSSGDGVFTTTLEFDPGIQLAYAFSYQNGPDSITEYIYEQKSLIGIECADEEGYRILNIESRNQTLPAVLFASCLTSPKLPEITFHVDLSKVSDRYEGGGVWVSFGKWDSWWVMRDYEGDGIYTATGLLEPGSQIKYFFGYQTGPNDNTDYTGERSLLRGLDCATTTGFRLLTVPDSALTLPALYYGTCQRITTFAPEAGEAERARVVYDATVDQIRIINAAEVEVVELFSITGQKLVSIRAHRQGRIDIQTNSLPKGVYVVRLKMRANKMQGVKFLK